MPDDESGDEGWIEWTNTHEPDVTGHRSPLSERVIGAMSAATDTDPTSLNPLGEVVDADALDALFGPKFDGTRRDDGRVTLEYCGRLVTVRPDGNIEIETLADY